MHACPSRHNLCNQKIGKYGQDWIANSKIVFWWGSFRGCVCYMYNLLNFASPWLFCWPVDVDSARFSKYMIINEERIFITTDQINIAGTIKYKYLTSCWGAFNCLSFFSHNIDFYMSLTIYIVFFLMKKQLYIWRWIALSLVIGKLFSLFSYYNNYAKIKNSCIGIEIKFWVVVYPKKEMKVWAVEKQGLVGELETWKKETKKACMNLTHT